MKTKKKPSKLCVKCSSPNLKTYLTTYPVKAGDKQLNVARVTIKECMDCHHLSPTKAGKEKIERAQMTFMTLFL
jgi:hypothetical protein